MTQEQMERAINFVVQHHAQFAVDIQQLKEAQAVTEQQTQQLQKQLQQLMKAQAESQTANDARFAQMMKAQAEAQAAGNIRFAELEQLIKKQAEAQANAHADNDRRLAETTSALFSLTTLAGRSVEDYARIEKKMLEAEERQWAAINETNARMKDLILTVERYIHSRN